MRCTTLVMRVIGPVMLRARKYATTNAALLYTAKGVASLLIPLASYWVVETGSWHDVFLAAALFNLFAAFLALAVLKPLRLPARAPAAEA